MKDFDLLQISSRICSKETSLQDFEKFWKISSFCCSNVASMENIGVFTNIFTFVILAAMYITFSALLYLVLLVVLFR